MGEEATIEIREYNYWDNLNKPYIISTFIFGIIELVLSMIGVTIAYIFALIFFGMMAYGFYSALPPKWVRDAMEEAH